MKSLLRVHVPMLLSLLLLLLLPCCQALNDCPMLQESQLGNFSAPSREGLLASTLGAMSGEGGSPALQILEWKAVCLGQGTVRDTYRSISLLARYRRSADGAAETVQVEYQCDDQGEWGFGSDPSVTTNPAANLSTALRTDCSLCVRASVALNASEEEHCLACSPSCTGLERCGGPPTMTCCNFFDASGTCVSSCSNNSALNTTTFTCDCDSSGGECPEDDESPCEPEPCRNGGTCMDMVIDFACSCAPGFTGDTCGVGIDECSPNPCQNGGNCTDDLNSFTCACSPGFTGDTCSTNIDECSPNPCQNGGTCADGLNSFACTCVQGFIGDTCSTNIDECSPNPCQNEGTCIDDINDFTCVCATGFTGDSCGINIDDCSPNPCQNGATCTDGLNSFSCDCPEPWIGDVCDSCPQPGCVNCSVLHNQTLCSSCTEGFTLSNGTCECNATNCLECSEDGRCEMCAEGFESLDMTCRAESMTTPETDTPDYNTVIIIGVVVGSSILVIMIVIILLIAFMCGCVWSSDK